MKKLLIVATTSLAFSGAIGAGFGIYEASARGNAMGGAVVGDVNDATASYHNPANLAFIRNVQVAAGVTFINPYCDVEVDHQSQGRMNPGWFTVPTFYATIPLPFDVTFGWGNYTEYGLGSEYARRWKLAGDTQRTTLEQMTLNPNLAYKITDRWGVSAGIRGSWISFCNRKQPNQGDSIYGSTTIPTPYGNFPASYRVNDAYALDSKLKGDDWSMGWTASTSYRLLDNLKLGLVYRSQIRHKLKGDFKLNGVAGGTPIVTVPRVLVPALGRTVKGDAQYQEVGEWSRASAKVRLPQSVTFGANWDVTDRFRVGSSITWTQWSSLDKLRFEIPGGAEGRNRTYTQKFNWHDTYRVGVGIEYDLFDWMAVRCGYTFDQDPTSRHHQSTMLPGGDRHIIGTGLGFKITENLRLDLGYNFIRMNNEHYWISTQNSESGEVKRHYMSCHNGYSHLASATISYSF